MTLGQNAKIAVGEYMICAAISPLNGGPKMTADVRGVKNELDVGDLCRM